MVVIIADGPERAGSPCALRHSLWIVRENHDRALRQASNVARAARTWKPHRPPIPMAPGRVEISEPIYFRCSEEANIHAALLGQRHHGNHVAAKRGLEQVGRITHGVKR